ncbi:NAD(P)-binding protein [Pseudoduganella sp. UC29_106]|uniref:NAD(P)-binding protein n=1 Tax=Pseudoduganella sp. UC29_106 TaxID=3374553 RepID=UPI0037580187
MLRRSFLAWAGAAAVAGAGLAGFRRWQEVTPRVLAPGRDEGHFLRDHGALPPPSKVLETDVLILGSGIGAQTAAWKLRKEGHGDFLMLDGPERYGNAAGGRFGELGFPTGAHYLPLPSQDCFHVREILADLGVIQRDVSAARPYYDERFLLHAPEERVLYKGVWQEGVLPHEGVPDTELSEHRRFMAQVEALREARGRDGRRVFTFPTAACSSDPEWLRLDALSFAQWLDREGYRSPSLRWYLDYCCRDDYGAASGKVSAWAGLHYFCGRGAEAANAEQGAWLTWPEGLQALASGLERQAQPRWIAGTAVSVRAAVGRAGVEASCFVLEGGKPRTFTVRARKAICAMPLHVAARVVQQMPDGFDAARHQPQHAPWLVANFLMKRFPSELAQAPLSWDNVVYGGKGLGYVVSTHQDIRVTPPERTVFTAYTALSDREPAEARRWMQSASGEELLALASSDLREAYGARFAAHVERVDITLRAHAMAIPQPGFRSNAGLQALREYDGPILFAHSDLSGFSVFEEASWWGYRAAGLAMR